ncbi:MAG: hypothetical protein KDJ40_10610 [Hyphomicrobiales bacterium]|nr:hypothetical protein [Hyphomicrobiales bacterium]MCO5086008.1 hypothetical protein [Methylobacteriaceae bacterium]
MPQKRTLLGFQLCDQTIGNVQGDTEGRHPPVVTNYPSFAIFAPHLAERLAIQAGPEYLLQPIFDGDVEEPLIVEAV